MVVVGDRSGHAARPADPHPPLPRAGEGGEGAQRSLGSELHREGRRASAQGRCATPALPQPAGSRTVVERE